MAAMEGTQGVKVGDEGSQCMDKGTKRKHEKRLSTAGCSAGQAVLVTNLFASNRMGLAWPVDGNWAARPVLLS